jgi:hypothetical protein
MRQAKGKQPAVTPRERAEFLATQADMANQVNRWKRPLGIPQA